MRVLTPRKLAGSVAAAFAVLALSLMIAPEVGPIPASLGRVILGRAAPSEREIVLRHRLPRAVFAAVCGGTLAACGGAMQAILGNPLASPYTLGIASGAGLAAVIAMKLGLEGTVAGYAALPAAAFLGALAAAAAVWGLAKASGRGRLRPEGMLLAGVTLGLIASAGILLVQYLSSPHETARMVRWMMGGLSVVGWRNVLGMLPMLLPGLVLVSIHAGRLNQMALGEEIASGRGIDPDRLRALVLLGCALATGAVVSVAGPIAFLGLIVPHAIRFLVGPDHRALLPCAFLGGGAFLVLCDTGARTVIAPSQIPVGVLTALMGGPFFIWLLVRRQARPRPR